MFDFLVPPCLGMLNIFPTRKTELICL
jgi:hypothetical protein